MLIIGRATKTSLKFFEAKFRLLRMSWGYLSVYQLTQNISINVFGVVGITAGYLCVGPFGIDVVVYACL